MSKIKFNELQLSDEIKKAIEEMGFEKPSKIQEKSIPVALDGRDIIGQAQTGTGKTLAFGSVLLSNIEHSDYVQGIVLSPTRELANQIYEEFKRIGRYTDLRFTCVYGGSEIERQIRTIKKGVDIVIGTPGRIMDLMRRRVLKVDQVQYFVLDEADEMLNMGFIEDIETIIQTMPTHKQTLLFSATMPDGIKKIASNYMKKNYLHIRIKEKQQTAINVKQYFYVVNQKRKFEVLCRVLDSMDMSAVIIFCKTKRTVDELTTELVKHNYNAACMHGDMTQNSRMHTLQRYKEGHIQFLVATDVAARGIDVENITHVINYELPQEDELYIHRIGRTGRAGHKGEAYTLVTSRELNILRKIERKTNSHFIELEIPSADDIFNQKIKELLFDVQDMIDTKKHIEFYDVVKEIPSSMRNEVLAALLAMNYRERVAIEYEDDDQLKEQGLSSDYDRLFLNRGKMDKINKTKILDFIEQIGQVDRKEVGDITIKRKFCFVNVKKEFSEQIVTRCYNKKIGNRKVHFEYASAKE